MKSINSDSYYLITAFEVVLNMFLRWDPWMKEHPSSYITAHVGRNAGINTLATVVIPSNIPLICCVISDCEIIFFFHKLLEMLSH